MDKILLTGFQQKQHIKTLLESYGKTATYLYESKRNKLIRRLCYIKQISNCDCLYFVGGIDGSNLLLKAAELMEKKIVIHWIGTDVYNLLHNNSYLSEYPKNIIHLSGSKLLHDELEKCGISSSIVPIVPFNMDFTISKMPENHAALIYLPSGKEAFYGVDLIKKLAEAHKDILFHIVANDYCAELDFPNVVFHGRLNLDEMSQLYDQISVLIRLPEHDGLSMMIIEALIKGKTVLYKYEHPYTITPASMKFEDVERSFAKILDSKPKINKEASDFIQEYYSSNAIMKKYIDSGIV